MSDSEFVMQMARVQGVSLLPDWVEAFVAPGGLYDLLGAIRGDIFARNVAGWVPRPDFDFRQED